MCRDVVVTQSTAVLTLQKYSPPWTQTLTWKCFVKAHSHGQKYGHCYSVRKYNTHTQHKYWEKESPTKRFYKELKQCHTTITASATSLLMLYSNIILWLYDISRWETAGSVLRLHQTEVASVSLSGLTDCSQPQWPHQAGYLVFWTDGLTCSSNAHLSASLHEPHEPFFFFNFISISFYVARLSLFLQPPQRDYIQRKCSDVCWLNRFAITTKICVCIRSICTCRTPQQIKMKSFYILHALTSLHIFLNMNTIS